MPRFVARRVVVEAHLYVGNTDLWPEAFRLAVVRHNNDGTIVVMTGDGPRFCKNGDWVWRGPDGTLTRYGAAKFETMFEPVSAEPEPEKRPTKRVP